MLYNIELDKETVLSRVLYSSIAHAISLSKYPELSYEQSWDGSNFSIQNGAGSRGTISISDRLIVGAFRSDGMADRNKMDAKAHLEGASNQIVSFAENETYQYLLDNINGEVRPVVTVAFFGENEDIYSNDSLPEFKKLTDHLIDFVFLGDEENKNYWNNEYDFSSDEINSVESLYQLKRTNLKEEIKFPKEVLLGCDFVSEESKEEVKASLIELKIRLV